MAEIGLRTCGERVFVCEWVGGGEVNCRWRAREGGGLSKCAGERESE